MGLRADFECQWGLTPGAVTSVGLWESWRTAGDQGPTLKGPPHRLTRSKARHRGSGLGSAWPVCEGNALTDCSLAYQGTCRDFLWQQNARGGGRGASVLTRLPHGPMLRAPVLTLPICLASPTGPTLASPADPPCPTSLLQQKPPKVAPTLPYLVGRLGGNQHPPKRVPPHHNWQMASARAGIPLRGSCPTTTGGISARTSAPRAPPTQ